MAVTWVLSIHPGAWDDADEAIDYYAGVEDGLPQRFIEELEDTFSFVRQFPFSGGLLHTKYRRVTLRHFPYLVCYQVIGVRVLAIVHNRRDPKWVRRRLANRI